MPEKKLINLQINEEEGSYSRMVVNGVAICVRSTIVIVSPADITRAELEDYIRECSFQRDQHWCIEDHPILGDIDSCSKDFSDLIVEIASVLNGFGISIVDMPAYKLDQ